MVTLWDQLYLYSLSAWLANVAFSIWPTWSLLAEAKMASELPPILGARFRFPRPLFVVEVAWQLFSPCPQSGVNGGTSAWEPHVPWPGSCSWKHTPVRCIMGKQLQSLGCDQNREFTDKTDPGFWLNLVYNKKMTLNETLYLESIGCIRAYNLTNCNTVTLKGTSLWLEVADPMCLKHLVEKQVICRPRQIW